MGRGGGAGPEGGAVVSSGQGIIVTLVGKRTNSRFVGRGRGHVVVSSGQGVILSL